MASKIKRERVLIGNLSNNIDKEVYISGYLVSMRDHSKILFINLRDRTGNIQLVLSDSDLIEKAKTLTQETPLSVGGAVVKRKPSGKEGRNDNIEVKVTSLNILSKPVALPFELNSDLNIDTSMDYRPLSLRREKERSIFTVQSKIVKALRECFDEHNFTEFQAPKIAGQDAEGGAAVFKIDYLDKNAFLTTSPQFYKQILVGSLERVFCIGNVFRGEKHATSRHLLEYTSIDAEFGFIESHKDVMNLLECLLRHTTKYIEENAKDELGILEYEKVKLPKDSFPSISFQEAKDLLKIEDNDLSPEDERDLSKIAVEKYNSDFVFVTGYPMNKRPMYTEYEEDNPEVSKSFDLLFRGVEIATGGQRINDYDKLVKQMEKKNVNPELFSFYLQAFKYGLPPHGGFGMGLERLTAKYVGIDNVKQASLFPREINRIDNRLK